MAGYREFQTGEVLTASNVNDYLMSQSIMKFADATARDTALGTAVGGGNALREGMVAYLDDEDLPSFYNGTSWTTEFGGGGLVAVKHVLKTDTFTASVTAGAGTAVTDLSITHALADASNKLIISAQFGTSANADGQGQVGITVADNGTLIAQPASPSNRTPVTTGARVTTGTDGLIGAYPGMTVVYAPGDTASHTYTVRAINIRSDTQTLYINRSEDDTDNALYPRGVSSFVIQEVAV